MTEQNPSPAQPFTAINDVYTVAIQAYTDERGQFMETFRREWFPQVSWEKLQNNRSDSKAGVLRGLHYHRQQVDYWIVPNGQLRAALVDLRQSSSTYGVAATIEMGGSNNLGLFIPEGVAHGFVAVTDCTLFYIVNNYYDGGKDEFGVAWNDPALNLDWGLTTEPILSGRDQQNPFLKDLPKDDLPG
jgi:dTDP-4-dehydrorhamnose 3,5-epimerase